jgi:MoaA/NifB/PqqE/SkfB family radical SAM enzyme
MPNRTLTVRERAFCTRELSRVRHITLDPRGPGVVRIHLIPPKKGFRKEPFLVLLNGAQLIPLNVSWAILLANFMDALAPFSGREIADADWQALTDAAVRATRRVYPLTKGPRISSELRLMLDALIAIARGQTPAVSVGAMSLGEYAPYMTAPHRMDLMVSAMTKDGAWHCNQKCLHCYAAGQPLSETRELDTAAWKSVLETLRRIGVPQVTFTGGEPTLRPDLAELVDAAQWFVTRLNTNGRLLTPALCAALYAASLDSVQITLYSADEAVHNALVGAPGFADTVQGIRNAVAAGLNVSVNTPLCSRNADYAATLAFAHSLGVRYATCSGLIPAGGAETGESRVTRLSPEALEAALRAGMETARTLAMEVDFTSPGWLPEQTLRALGFTLIPSCGACLSNMAVAPDGTVVPCQSWLSGTALGSILTDPWEAVWDSPACRAIRAESAKMEQLCQLHAQNRAPDAPEAGGC